jgi:arsenite-transporting ATPase
VLVAGTDLPLWGMEIDPEEAQQEFMAFNASNSPGGQVQDFLRGAGLGMVADQLADLKLGELLNTPPPGLDEAVAVAKVCVREGMCVSEDEGGGKGGGRT